MSEENNFEKMMLEVDSLLKKSQGFMLFTINQSGEFQVVMHTTDLSNPLTVGLQTMSQIVIDRAIDIQMSNYTMSIDEKHNVSLGEDFDDDDDQDDDQDGQ